MLEKLKDLLYETSDLILAFVILLVMSSVITWQVSDSMAFNQEFENTPTSVETPSSEESPIDEVPVAEVEEETPEDDDSTMDNEIAAEDDSTVDNESTTEDTTVIDESEEEAESTEAPDSTESEETDSPTEEVVTATSTDVTITIPSGTSGAGIAKILKDNHLIQDTAAFISRIEELNLAVKLKSGTFTINSGTSLDDIIYIITGQNR